MYISLLPPLESSHDPSDLSCDPNQKDGNHYSMTFTHKGVFLQCCIGNFPHTDHIFWV